MTTDRTRDSAPSTAAIGRNYRVGWQPRHWPRYAQISATPPLDGARPLSSLFRGNVGLLLVATLISLLTFTSSALLPWGLGRALDAGIANGITTTLLSALAVLVGIILLRAVSASYDFTATILTLRGGVATQKELMRNVSGVRGGGRTRIPAGEVVTAVTTDANTVGDFYIFAVNTVSALVSFGFIAVMMLRISVPLGMVVVIGMPILLAAMSFLVKPLQSRLTEQREERGKLTTLATDGATGLRILRGVGGEQLYAQKYAQQSARVRETGIKAALWQSILGAISTAAPAIFTALLIGGGIWAVSQGKMTIGSLVEFYGYAVYLAIPISHFSQFLQTYSDAKVAANRIKKICEIEPLTTDNSAASAQAILPAVGWEHCSLQDDETGIVLAPQHLTGIVSGNPEVSSALLARLARTDDAHPARLLFPAPADAETEIAEVRLSDLPLADVRKNIVFSEAVAQLFRGRLRSSLNAKYAEVPIPRSITEQMADTGDGSGVAHRQHIPNPQAAPESELLAALEIADGVDIVHGLHDGLDGYVGEHGRTLSGGQRQRVALARAVLHQPPILLLVDPTSAVDSHTEARIAQRLHAARAGKTTAIATVSPIMLHICDEVIFCDDTGAELARGSHRELLRRSDYDAVVRRGAADSGPLPEQSEEV
ncbi:MAG: ABC transporter ATP-binding protein [Trueperella sp.]|nr:ABC transporter ATP-binding protein [Trueperella sp.]